MNEQTKLGSWRNAVEQRRSVREFDSRPVAEADLRDLIWAAQGKTDASGNRTAPSAHALHPLRFFVMAAAVDTMTPGLYEVEHDSGELRLIHDRDIRPALETAALDEQPWVGAAPCVISVCADFVTPVRAFADQPPKGERGVRYVYIEAGASAQNVLLQATSSGLAGVLVAGFDDTATAEALSLPDGISPVLHLCVGWPAKPVDG